MRMIVRNMSLGPGSTNKTHFINSKVGRASLQFDDLIVF